MHLFLKKGSEITNKNKKTPGVYLMSNTHKSERATPGVSVFQTGEAKLKINEP